MSKTLRTFCLAAFVLALAVAPAMAIEMTLPHSKSDQEWNILSPDENFVQGTGTFTGGILAISPDLPEALELNTTGLLTIRPRTGMRIAQEFASPDEKPLQLVVNWGPEQEGKVVIHASNNSVFNPVEDRTYYVGGTLLRKGTLGVARNNALGQRWVAMYSHNDKAKAPIFELNEVSTVHLGDQSGHGDILSEATGNQRFTSMQPFYLLWDGIRDVPNDQLRYSKIDVPQGDVSMTEQGLHLDNGLDQRFILAEYRPDQGFTTPPLSPDYAGIFLPGLDIWTPSHNRWDAEDRRLRSGTDRNWPLGRTENFVRLVKTGPGRLVISGGTSTLANAARDLRLVNASDDMRNMLGDLEVVDLNLEEVPWEMVDSISVSL